MSRIACDWICDRPNCVIRPSRASDGVLRPANQRDHRVEVVERDLQPFEDVIARFRLPQLELGAPADDLAAELDEALDQLEQRHHLRPAADDGEHDDAEAQLQLGVLVEVVENHLRHFAALQLDDDAHAVAVGLVPQVGNALDRLLAHQIGDPLDQLRLVDLIRDLGDDDRLAVAFLVGLDLRSRAHQDRAAAGRVGLHGALASDDLAGGRKVRRRNQSNEVAQFVRARSDALPPRRSACFQSARCSRRSPRAGCAAARWSPCRRRCRPIR